MNDCDFSINVVPHTLSNTIIGEYKVSQKVNIEIDTIARYIERLAAATNIDRSNNN